MKSYKNLLLNYCLNDDDFKGAYNAAYKLYPDRLLTYKEELINALDYILQEKLNIYLDQYYIDYSYITFKGKKKIIDLDTIYMIFKDILNDKGAY